MLFKSSTIENFSWNSYWRLKIFFFFLIWCSIFLHELKKIIGSILFKSYDNKLFWKCFVQLCTRYSLSFEVGMPWKFILELSTGKKYSSHQYTYYTRTFCRARSDFSLPKCLTSQRKKNWPLLFGRNAWTPGAPVPSW